MIGQLLSAANVVLALSLAVLSWRLFRQRKGQRWNWLLIGFVLISLYWSAVYGYVFFTDPGHYNATRIGVLYIRPAITATMGLMVAEALLRGK